MPPKAYRWVPEMLEIAKTFEGVELTPRILLGAAAGVFLQEKLGVELRERGDGLFVLHGQLADLAGELGIFGAHAGDHGFVLRVVQQVGNQMPHLHRLGPIDQPAVRAATQSPAEPRGDRHRQYRLGQT